VLLASGLPPFPIAGVATPNLDRLARHGRRFDRAYTSYPSPAFARATLLTGRRANAWRADPARLAREASLPGHFSAHGYVTTRVGRLLGPLGEEALHWGRALDVADEADALRSVQAQVERSGTEPFLVVAALDGGEPPAALVERQRAALAALPPVLLAPLPRIAFAAERIERAGSLEQPGPRPESQREELVARSRARLAALDEHLGPLLDAMDRREQWSRCVVVLVSDHAPAAGEHGLLPRPDTLFESTLHVPLVVAGAGVAQPGTVSRGLVELTDVAPTLLELAGLPPLPDRDGLSLGPALRDPDVQVRRAALSEALREIVPLGRSVRTDRYRFTAWPDGSEELYDHEADPREWRNLAGGPAPTPLLEEARRTLGQLPGAYAATAPAPKPRARNVLLLIFDDMDTRLSAYGSSAARTPSIDRLAARGRLFERAYAQFPVCSPSRTSFLAGRRPEAFAVWANDQPVRERLGDAEVLPDYFRAHGFFTARIGKVFHQRWDTQFAWDIAVADPAQEPVEPGRRHRGAHRPRGAPVAEEVDDEEPGSVDLSRMWVADEAGDEEQGDTRRAQYAAELLEQHRDGPFFIAVGFAKPHLRWVFPKRYLELHPPAEIRWPEEPQDDVADVPRIALAHDAPERPRLLLEPVPPRYGEEDRRRAIAAHDACVSFVDAQLGHILDALDQLDLWSTTAVVLLSDHGFHLGEHGGLWRKDTLFEEALHVPLIVASPHMRQPGVPARGIVELLDLYPTLLELTGLPAPKQPLDGRSLLPLVDDPARPGKAAAFSLRSASASRFGRSVRTERFRLTEWPDGTRELYDIAADPGEARNLAAAPEQAANLASLRELLYAAPPALARR